MSASVAISASVTKVSRSIPAAVNAASVGANTVNGPSACRAVTRSALARAATREVWIPVPVATVGMSPGATGATGGMSTASITWMTPLLDWTSAVVTLAPSIETAPSEPTANTASAPLNMVTTMPSATSAEATAPS